MSQKTDFRLASSSEIELITSFQIKMAKETENLDLNLETVTKGVSAVFEDKQRGDYFVALQDNIVVGCLLMTKEWSDWRNGYVCWIHSLYIKPEYRGKKLFSNFYIYLQKYINSQVDCFGLRLYVDKKNISAQKIYSKLGMNQDHYLLYEKMKS